MGPDAANNVAVLFIAVFGSAAIFFGWIIWVQKYGNESRNPYGMGQILGLPGAIAMVIFASVVLSFWK